MRSSTTATTKVPLLKHPKTNDDFSIFHALPAAYAGFVLGLLSQIATFAIVSVLFVKISESRNFLFAVNGWCFVQTLVILSIIALIASSTNTSANRRHNSKNEAVGVFCALIGIHVAFLVVSLMLGLPSFVRCQVVYSVVSIVAQFMVMVWSIRYDNEDNEEEKIEDANEHV